MNKEIKLAIMGGVLLVLIVVLFAINPVVVVGAGERGVVTNWGAVDQNILGEGIHMRVPFQQSVHKLDVKIQKEQTDASAASKDLQNVKATIALNYHLDPNKVANLWQKVGSDYKALIIDPAVQEAVKATTAKYTAEELITKRQEAKDGVKALLTDRLLVDDIVVDEVSIVNFEFSESFNSAIEAKVTAEQDALAAKNKLEQVKFEADQRVAQARAEAEAIKIQAEAVTQQGGADYVQLQAIKQWDGKLPQQFIPGQTMPFINLTPAK